MKSIVRMGLICTLIVGSVLVYAETSPKWDWPFKRLDIQVMNTISSLQFYGPTPGFHHGVDLLAKGKEAVYAPVSGKIGSPNASRLSWVFGKTCHPI